MNMKTPTHLLQDSQPTCDTSAEAVHKSPLDNSDGSLSGPQPQQPQYQQQQQQQQSQQPQLNDQVNNNSSSSAAASSCGAHAHRPVGGSHKSENSGVSATVCSNCGTTTTPLWRRAPNGETICNACGLYLKARNTVRPPWLKRNAIKKVPAQPAHESTGGSCPGDGHCNGTGGSTTCDGCPAYNQHQVNRQALVCANCRTTTTPLWRRDEAGNTICNACGLYYKLHNVHRPVTMKRSVIKRRKRVALASSPQPHHHHHHIAPSPSVEDGDLSDQAPGLSPESSSGETGSGTEEDESTVHISRKRKAVNEPARNLKRIDVGSRSVPAIEDYIQPKRIHSEPWVHNPSKTHVAMQQQQQQQQQAARDMEERRRSLSPVEPSTFHSASAPLLPAGPQVQIHNHHRGSSAYHNGSTYQQRPVSPVSSEPAAHVTTTPVSGASYTSHGISALLNPTSTSSVAHQQPQPQPQQQQQHQLPSISLPHVSSIAAPTLMAPYPQQAPAPQQYTAQPQPPVDFNAQHTQQVLAAHRQELQREVSNLTVLLTRTAAMLNNLDHAMAVGGQQQPSQQGPTSPGQPSALSSLLGTDPLASIMALSNAAASSAYVTPTSSSPVQPSMNLPPLSAHQSHHGHHLPPVMIPHPSSPSRAGSKSPQQLPTPPSGPGASPTILPLPIVSHFSRS